jgi:hypothetical protein
MTNLSRTKPPVWFWIISVLALLWNAMGVGAYLFRAYATDEMIAQLTDEQKLEFSVQYPAWVTAAFALAVFCGLLGCFALLLRKKWAYFLFIISTIAAIAMHAYLFMNVEMQSLIMPIMVIIVCAILVLFSKNSITKDWLR